MSDSPHRRVGAVILAAGASTRLGYPKQLIEHEGEALVRRAAMSAIDAGADPVIVVVGASAETVSEALVGLERVDVLYNARWETGLASSLAAGLNAVRSYPNCDGALVMVADQPLIDVATLRQLIDAFDSDDRIVASAYDDIVGVPIVLGAEFFKDLMNLKGDEGAGRWLRARLKDVTQIPVATASMDIDTPADAERLASDTSSET
jgi:CTP:molybdopterin cytidylyltransferase MocA